MYPPAVGSFETSQLVQQITEPSKDFREKFALGATKGGRTEKGGVYGTKKETIISVPTASGRIRNSYGPRGTLGEGGNGSAAESVHRKRRRSVVSPTGRDVDARSVFQCPEISIAGRSPVDHRAARDTLLPQPPATSTPRTRPLNPDP